MQANSVGLVYCCVLTSSSRFDGLYVLNIGFYAG